MCDVRGRRKMHTTFWWETVKKRDRFEHLDVYRRIILKQILKNIIGGDRLDSSGLG
jgi:hypothetical protein